ncbi:hypothetical protein GOBAR_AA19962 [Gossypium barbadense]|uniref:Uncharacterized protein n=1 Tax=Gossypium barbadense TaxID=3634 RepID=A0A2P5XBI3_GOSBA|nr:hypothetical protein GOBAR_AA19962 [Gossypium barbadense]
MSQILFTIQGHSLEHFLDSSTTPPSKFSATASGESIPNATYTHFFKQDCALASWLLFTVSSNILLDAKSYLHEPLYLPLSINTAQVIAPTPIDFVFTLRLMPNTSGPSACSIPFHGQTQFLGHFLTFHFIPRPQPFYSNCGRSIQTYSPPQPPVVNPSVNIYTYNNPSQYYDLAYHIHTSLDGFALEGDPKANQSDQLVGKRIP